MTALEAVFAELRAEARRDRDALTSMRAELESLRARSAPPPTVDPRLTATRQHELALATLRHDTIRHVFAGAGRRVDLVGLAMLLGVLLGGLAVLAAQA